MVLLSAAAVGLSAAPRLIIDTAEYRAGVINEGKTAFIRHTFTLKNAGDSALKIIKIKANCSCTSYNIDSVIPPHRSGHITMELDLSEVSETNFYKSLLVRTNDPRSPGMRLAISGTLKFIINVVPAAVVLPTMGKKDTIQEVSLITAKHDLKVNNVFFVIEKPSAEWLANVPIRFAFDKNGKKNTDGTFSYTLKLFYTPVGRESAGYGQFIVQTNHPDKPEIKIGGALDPVKQP